MGRRVDGKFDSLKAKARRAWYLTKVWTVIIATLSLAVAIGATVFSTSTIVASANTTTTVVKNVPTDFPVLDRIGDCESGNGTAGSATQFHNGQVIFNANTNDTVDVGKYQINSVYFKKATELGYNLTTEQGNTDMAVWIFVNVGTAPWSSSAKCWYKTQQ